jgi:DegV family protein with EDD domain
VSVRVVTDSASDVPPELAEQLGISIVPLTIRFGDEEFVDRAELTTEEFWAKLETSTVLPETAAPSVGAFEETFRRLVDDGADGIVCVNLSAGLSATMQSAQVAAKAFEGGPPIEIIDSKTATVGIALLAIYAAQRAREGAAVDVIAREVLERRDRSHLFGTLDTLEFLKRGGRIGAAQAALGSMLSIKPIVTTADGVVAPAGKVRTRSKALRFLVDRVEESRVEQLAVMHANAPDIDEFLGMLEPVTTGIDVMVGVIGPVVGVHTGPRTIGLCWTEPA